MSERELTWQAFEYKWRERSPDWFWALAIIAVSLAIVAILFNNILFAAFIAIGSFTLAMYAKRPPQRISVTLTSQGIVINERVYSWSTLESFWLEDRDGDPRIIFKPLKVYLPFLITPVEGIQSDIIREYIDNFLPEEEHHEPITHKFMEYLGF